MKKEIKIKRTSGNWFAWYPVKLNDNRFAWFEKVLRTPIYADGYFQYYSYELIAYPPTN